MGKRVRLLAYARRWRQTLARWWRPIERIEGVISVWERLPWLIRWPVNVVIGTILSWLFTRLTLLWGLMSAEPLVSALFVLAGVVTLFFLSEALRFQHLRRSIAPAGGAPTRDRDRDLYAVSDQEASRANETADLERLERIRHLRQEFERSAREPTGLDAGALAPFKLRLEELAGTKFIVGYRMGDARASDLAASITVALASMGWDAAQVPRGEIVDPPVRGITVFSPERLGRETPALAVQALETLPFEVQVVDEGFTLLPGGLEIFVGDLD